MVDFDAHLQNVKNQKDELIEEYFPEPSEQRHKFEVFISGYLRQLDSLAAEFSNSSEDQNICPFVIIGSEVEVEDLDTKESFTFTVVGPYKDNIQNGHVSYLSPVGRSLLFKKNGELVTVNAPGGVFNYTIKSIKMPKQE
ncbi:MAG: GreA/GreB family elongation factor [Clostridia bacterium]|nr:GreA/GreB family elongation factor [Clostridia bacterium]